MEILEVESGFSMLKGRVSSTQLECFKVESEILEVESYVCSTFRISATELEC